MSEGTVMGKGAVAACNRSRICSRSGKRNRSHRRRRRRRRRRRLLDGRRRRRRAAPGRQASRLGAADAPRADAPRADAPCLTRISHAAFGIKGPPAVNEGHAAVNEEPVAG